MTSDHSRSLTYTCQIIRGKNLELLKIFGGDTIASSKLRLSLNIIQKLERFSSHSRHLNEPTMALSAFYTSSVFEWSTLHFPLNGEFSKAHIGPPCLYLSTKRFVSLKIAHHLKWVGVYLRTGWALKYFKGWLIGN